MAWVRKLPSGLYDGRYRDPAGKTRQAPGGPFRHKAAAQRAAASAEAEARKPGWRSPDAAKATWGEWYQVWWASRDVEDSTRKTDRGRLDNHLLPRWRDVPLADITRQDIRTWAVDLKEGTATGEARRALTPATVQRIVHLFSGSLAAAVDAGVLAANPAARLRLGGGHGSPERYLTHEEFNAVRDKLEGPYRTMAELLVYTGMRWGEAAGLHTSRMDAKRGTVLVAEVWSLTAKQIKAYPKGRRRREVPLPDWLELASSTAKTCGYEHPGSRCRSGLAVPSTDGEVLSQPGFTWAWRRAVEAAGIGPARPHDLRHTYASWLLQDGVSLAEVGRLLGHVSPVTTQRYAHLAETPRQAVLDALRHGAEMAQPDAKQGRTGLRVIRGGRAG